MKQSLVLSSIWQLLLLLPLPRVSGALDVESWGKLITEPQLALAR
jgi:hypothetical protein